MVCFRYIIVNTLHKDDDDDDDGDGDDYDYYYYDYDEEEDDDDDDDDDNNNVPARCGSPRSIFKIPTNFYSMK